MAMTGVLRPGHISLRVLDLEEGINFYKNTLGLVETGRDDQGRVYFKAWDERDHNSVLIREATEAGVDFFAFKVADKATLEKLDGDLQAFGLTTERIPAGEMLETGERVRFKIPSGHFIELYAEKTDVGNGQPYVNPNPWIPAAEHGIAPSRMDHCLLYGDDLDGSVKLFTEVLGFGIAEQVMLAGDKKFMIGAFLSCSNKAHDVAFIRQPVKGKFHHASFELRSWEQVLRAGDILSRTKTSIDIGPTRHGITRGETIYFFDPSGNRNEVFSGGYIYYPDKPVITWYDESLGPAIFYHDRKLNEAFLSVFT